MENEMRFKDLVLMFSGQQVNMRHIELAWAYARNDEYSELMIAHANGAKIEVLVSSEDWCICEPRWDFPASQYRVAGNHNKSKKILADIISKSIRDNVKGEVKREIEESVGVLMYKYHLPNAVNMRHELELMVAKILSAEYMEIKK